MGISDKWEGSEPLAANARLQAISDARSGGPVEIRFNGRGREVLALFTQSSNQELAGDIAKIVGDRDAANLRKSLFGGDLVVHIPAQTYVDKLDGQIPGYTRQL